MSSSPESTFTQYLLRKLPDDVYSLKVMIPTSSGVPDTYISGYRSDLWAEMKWVKIPKRDTTEITPDVSALQERWLKGRYNEGRNVCVIVGSPIGCCVLQDKHMFNTIVKSQLTMDKKDVVQWLINQTRG